MGDALLHQRIVYLPCRVPFPLKEDLDEARAYQHGHQDARLAAAELVAAATSAQEAQIARLREALENAQRAINSMKVEAETSSFHDEESMREACELISQEGLEADTAIRAALKETQ